MVSQISAAAAAGANGVPDIGEIRRGLAALDPAEPDFRARPKRAAVALILAGREDDPSLCLIRRAEHAQDPWSGHMAFPGGRVDPGDPTPRAAAEREAMEEVGLALAGGEFLGPVAEIPVYAKGRDTDMALFAFAYYLGPAIPALRPNREVADAFWAPLSHMFDERRLDEVTITREGIDYTLPAVTLRGRPVWGVTYRVFYLFARALSRALPEGPTRPPQDPPPAPPPKPPAE